MSTNSLKLLHTYHCKLPFHFVSLPVTEPLPDGYIYHIFLGVTVGVWVSACLKIVVWLNFDTSVLSVAEGLRDAHLSLQSDNLDVLCRWTTKIQSGKVALGVWLMKKVQAKVLF